MLWSRYLKDNKKGIIVKILVNYDIAEKGHLSALVYILKSKGLEAVGSSKTFSASSLVDTAKKAGCSGILLCNTSTLLNLVDNPKATLDNYRGSRFAFPVPTIVCNRINHIHSVPHGRFLLEKDLDKFKSINVKAPSFSFTVLEKQRTYEDVLEEMSKSILTAYDIETLTLNEINEKSKKDGVLVTDPRDWKAGDTIISCASWSCLFATGVIKTWVLPLVDFGQDHWREEGQYEAAILFLQKANKLPTTKVMHNGIYDCTHSIVYHAEPYNYSLDTMALAHAEYSELPKTLDFVASIHLPYYMQWKDESEKASKEKDIHAYWTYNAKDTWHTLLICLYQLRNMPVYAKHNFADKFKLVYPSLYCAFEGFKIDLEAQDKVREEATVRLNTHLNLLRTYVADQAFNPGSWQQVQKYVYRVFGGINPKIGKSAAGTDEKNLSVVGDQHPLLALLTHSIIEYKGEQKAIGTYFNFLKKNNRLLWNLNPFGAETERMACNASSFWCGTQVQNIPKYAKVFLVADEGFTLVEVDNKQSEGRCTAYLAEDLALIKAIEDKEFDFYKTLGTLFFNIPYIEVTQFFRDKVLKKIVHGTNYMMGAKTFKENIGIKILHETAAILGFKLVPKPSPKRPKEKTILGFCKELLDKYHVPFKRVKEWYVNIYNEVKATRMLKSPLGHVRYFFGDIEKDHNMLRSAVAHQPQNLSVSILNIGLWKVYKQMVVRPVEPLKLGDFRLKAQIHDSILAQYRKDLEQYCVKMMMRLMDNPVTVKGRELRIPVDAKVGTVWGKSKDFISL